MIFTSDKIVASVDITTGYPGVDMDSLYNAIIDYVVENDSRIMPCDAYHKQKSARESGQPYICRAGYHFRFWFIDREEAAKFADRFKGTIEVPAILPKNALTP